MDDKGATLACSEIPRSRNLSLGPSRTISGRKCEADDKIKSSGLGNCKSRARVIGCSFYSF